MPMALGRDIREEVSLPARTGVENRSKGAEKFFLSCLSARSMEIEW